MIAAMMMKNISALFPRNYDLTSERQIKNRMKSRSATAAIKRRKYDVRDSAELSSLRTSIAGSSDVQSAPSTDAGASTEQSVTTAAGDRRYLERDITSSEDEDANFDGIEVVEYRVDGDVHVA